VDDSYRVFNIEKNSITPNPQAVAVFMFGSPFQEPENKRHECGKQDTGGQGKEKTEMVFFDVDVARQLAEPGNTRGKGNDNSNG
jgi:hypothetical protein